MIALKQVFEAYKARGFKICHIQADEQFEHARKQIEQMGIMLNVTIWDEHVPEIDSKRKSTGYIQHTAFLAIP